MRVASPNVSSLLESPGQSDALRNALEHDVARALGVPASRVSITTLRAVSESVVDVGFVVVSTPPVASAADHQDRKVVSLNDVDAFLAAAQSRNSSTAWMADTIAMLPSKAATVTSASAAVELASSPSRDSCGSVCATGLGAGFGLMVALAIGVGVFWYRRRRREARQRTSTEFVAARGEYLVSQFGSTGIQFNDAPTTGVDEGDSSRALPRMESTLGYGKPPPSVPTRPPPPSHSAMDVTSDTEMTAPLRQSIRSPASLPVFGRRSSGGE